MPQFSVMAALTSIDQVFIDVPNVTTGQVQGFTVRVRNGFHVFRGVGWVVTLVKLPVPRVEANVLPATIPASSPSDSGVLASVTLPESAGPTQYWVPVLESHLAAALHAREWTVIFHKAPRPVA